ncbi:ATP-binding protein [Salinimonas iocasae]|uniref:ATP-binding protein n=1 Tax=Salinimonas iocasae TaxID=2572577 RepID=UPI00143D8FC3|nr:ATP-binding protein [Salinimonas iocasae]
MLERALTARVIERLRKIFGHRSELNVLLWEEQPLEARESFQPQLPDPATVDLFILILWQRTGTLLPESALPATFAGPLTGTEYEFIAARKAQQTSGKPAVMVYRRTDKAGENASPVNAFFNRHFTDNQQRLSNAYHQYKTIGEFECLLEKHLHRWLDNFLPTPTETEMINARAWYSGNPFQGLKAFRFEHANVFCGRDDAIAEALEKLKYKAVMHQPFLLIVGMSGSGKSSLARAGILPALYNPDLLPGSGTVLRGVMRPADIEGDPFRALVSALAANSAQQLVPTEQINATATLARNDKMAFLEQIRHALEAHHASSTLVILIDQLEELYTSAAISVTQQKHFAELVAALVEELDIFVIATLRSDCYHHLCATPEFLRLKQHGGQYDLSPPSLYNIRQMITTPAIAAHLHFEEGEKGQPPLDEVIADRAAQYPESLPLLEFTLTQLYDMRTPGGMLTFKHYALLGGIEGAIASHAETIFRGLGKAVQKRFAQVFNQLTSCDPNGRYLRKWAVCEQLQSDAKARQLVEAFLRARLLVSERNPDDIEIITLAHESLYIHWPRLARWLQVNRSLLNVRDQLSDQVTRWIKANREPALLLNAGKPLDDGKALLKSELTLTTDQENYIKASERRARRAQALRYAAIGALIATTLYATSASFSARKSQQTAERSLAKSQDLIEFLIGDLHTELDKLGRLDVMQSVGEKALNYFAELEETQTSDTGLLNRTKALYQIGSVYMDSAQYDKATQAFEQSLAQARKLTTQSPDKFDYIYEQAQAEFWLGYAHWVANELDKAERQFLAYRKAALRLRDLAPSDTAAMMEVAYANSNLGTLADSRGNIDGAIAYFLKAAEVTVQVVSMAPENLDAIATLADVYSWLGSAHQKQLKLTQALSFYRSEKQLFEQIARLENSYRARINVVLANNRLAKVQVYSGNIDSAVAIYQAQKNTVEELVRHDQENTRWREILASIHAFLGEAYLLGNQLTLAEQSFDDSFSIDARQPEQGGNYWTATFYHRHYWYWRLLKAQGKDSKAQSFEKTLLSANEPAARLWRFRVGSALKLPNVDVPDNLLGPGALIALYEKALSEKNHKQLEKLVSKTPELIWQYPELAALQTDIQTVLALNSL